jgi:hypothetical protein
MPSFVMLSIIFSNFNGDCRYAECLYAECRGTNHCPHSVKMLKLGMCDQKIRSSLSRLLTRVEQGHQQDVIKVSKALIKMLLISVSIWNIFGSHMLSLTLTLSL